MATFIPIPKLGQSEETVKIEKWRVKEGDKIRKGDVLFEVETDKAVLEVESQFEGTLLKIIVQSGVEAPVMSVAAVIGSPDEKIPEIPSAPKPAPSPAPSAPKDAKSDMAKSLSPSGEAEKVSGKAQSAPSPEAKATESARLPRTERPPRPSPRARRFSKDYLIDISKVEGSGGKAGRVTEADVKRYLESSGYLAKKIGGAALNLAKKEKLELLSIEGGGDAGRITLADVKSAAFEKSRELSTMRKSIARRLSDSKRNIPHFYVTVSVDMSEISSLRGKLKADGISLSVSDFIVKACALTLKEFPMMNAESDGVTVRYKSKINIGVAVSLDNGLVVPVVRNADKKDLDEIHETVAELADKARKGKLSPDEMKGGTFTISNMGMLGVENFAAIINPGESAILAVSSAIPSPTVRNGEIAVRDIMKMTVSADHRIVDGADAAKFANSLKAKLESPQSLAQFI